MESKTVVIKQRITKQAHEALKKEAEKRGITMTMVIREILHEWAKKNG